MFFFLPLGVEEATVDRIPWVSIAIAALCVVAFTGTWVLPANPEGASEEEAATVLRYWETHPYLELPAAYSERFLLPEAVTFIEGTRQAYTARNPEPVEEEVRAAQQAHLDALAENLIARADRAPLRRLGLVPARGAAQLGWLTHMFLHLGWLHLLGNLLFFYLVGPLLEDVWGRALFPAFYVVGGLVAALAHFLLDPGSQGFMVGASGAIAACMGAFALRYARRRIRMAYFVWISVRVFRGTFLMPAWLWGLLWFGNEVLSFLLNGGDGQVAVMAHIGGFGFGAAFAFALKASGLEAKYIAPEMIKKVGWEQHPAVAEAQWALERGDRPAAEAAYQRALAEAPDDTEAQLGMGKLELEAGRTAEGMRRLHRLFEQLVGRPSPDALVHAVAELGDLLDVRQLRPVLAYRMATALEAGIEGMRPRAEPLYAAAAKAGGVMGGKALARAAQLCLEQGGPPERALGHLEAAKALTGLPPELTATIAELEARAREVVAARPRTALEVSKPRAFKEGVESEVPERGSPGEARGPPRIMACRVVGMDERALAIESRAGKRTSLDFGQILAVAVGSIPAPPAAPGGPPRRTLLVDLVVSWGNEEQGPTVLRAGAAALGLQALYPGTPPREAFGRMLAHLLEASGASPLPDKPSLLEGRFPLYPDEAALNAALYGAPGQGS